MLEQTTLFRSLLILLCLLPGPANVTRASPHSQTYRPSTPAKINLTLGFLPSLTNDRGYNKYFLGALKYALDRINEQRYPFHLDYHLHDNRANSAEAIRGMTTQLFNGTVAFIGPEASCAIEARIAAAWNLPMIAFSCGESVTSDRKTFPTFVRTIPSTSKVSKSIISLMKNFSWTSYTAIVGNTTKWKEAAATLETLANANSITKNNVHYYPEPYIPIASDIMQELVERTYNDARIYVFLGDNHALLDFIRHFNSVRLNSKGEYVVIAVKETPYDFKQRNKDIKKYTDVVMVSEMVDAFMPVLMLIPREPSNKEYEMFIDMSRNYSYEEPFNVPRPPLNVKVPVPVYAAYLHDAVSVYARALNETLAANMDFRNGTDIVKRITGRTYESIQGHTVYIDESGDAEANYTVLALVDDPDPPPGSPDKRSMRSVGHFITRGDAYPVYYSDRDINWVGGRVPDSEPECGFDGRRCEGKVPQAWLVGVGCLICVLVVVMAIVLVARHYIYEQKLASLFWKIDFKEFLMADLENEQNLPEVLKNRAFLSLNHFTNDDSCHSSRSSRVAFTKVASYKGTLVAVKTFKKKHVEVTRAISKELYLMKEISHDNLNRFIGACIEPTQVCIVTQYCSRGSLKDILQNPDLRLDSMFIASLVFDLIKGMIYLHDSEIISHGNLKPSNCLVDSRWVLQVSDFGLHGLKHSDGGGSALIYGEDEDYFDKLLWRAPELLRNLFALPRGSQKGDVYSFALILYEIHTRTGPWSCTKLSSSEIIHRLKEEESVFRPDLSHLQCGDFVVSCIQECWSEFPDFRPDFKYIRIRLKSMQSGLRSNIFDNMLAIMEKYASTLETLVEERTNQLAEEKKKTEALLLRMLPKSVAEQLIGGEQVVPEHYDKVTIYFSDIVGFTTLSAESTPLQVVDMLNDLYTMFDSIIDCYDVYKVETIGDAYMVVSGLPLRNGDSHAAAIASMSLHLLQAIKGFTIKHRPTERLKLRIGIHTGPVVAGVVGLKMPRFCLFGDTVNTASRMESTGIAFTIHCSEQCKELLDRCGGYLLEPRGSVSMKGKGEMFTYFLVAKLHCNAPDNNNCLSPIAEVKATSDDSAIGSSTIYDQSWDPKYSPPESPTKELPPVKYMSIESVF